MTKSEYEFKQYLCESVYVDAEYNGKLQFDPLLSKKYNIEIVLLIEGRYLVGFIYPYFPVLNHSLRHKLEYKNSYDLLTDWEIINYESEISNDKLLLHLRQEVRNFKIKNILCD